MADLEVYPGEEICVVTTNLYANTDAEAAAKMIGHKRKPEGRALEKGFSQSALHGPVGPAAAVAPVGPLGPAAAQGPIMDDLTGEPIVDDLTGIDEAEVAE